MSCSLTRDMQRILVDGKGEGGGSVHLLNELNVKQAKQKGVQRILVDSEGEGGGGGQYTSSIK